MPLHSRNPRKAAIDSLINRGIENPLVDNAALVSLFESMTPQALTFERTGYDTITPALQSQIDNDGPYKAFLLGYVDEAQTVTVFQAIQATIQDAL